MASKVPTIRQMAWLALIPQLLFFGLLFLIWKQSGSTAPYSNALLSYLGLSFSLQVTIPRSHRKGMLYVKKQEYVKAIRYFEQGYDFFTRYAWLDKYRYIFITSGSKASYKEMALNNIAFCYGQIGDGKRSKEYYERALQEFPDSGLAKTALNMISSAENSSEFK